MITMNTKFLLFTFTMLFVHANVYAQNPTDARPADLTAAIDRVKTATQELLDAVAPGNKAVWEKYLAQESIYTDEEGRVLTRRQLLDELKPLPKGYIGSIRIGETKVAAQENIIVLSHLDHEDLELYGQKIYTKFHTTSTWVKQKDGQWKLLSTHVMAIPNERKQAAVNSSKLNDYVGVYRLSPEVTYTVSVENGTLYGQRTGRLREELLPLCNDMFYKRGVWRGEKVFERNGEGLVIKMADRRENNDLVWSKVK